MTNRQFRQALHDTAREAIPDNWTRWEQIRGRIQEKPPLPRPAPRTLSLSTRRIAILLMILLTSTVAYGVLQVTRPLGDPGLVGVEAAGYITELNMSRVVDGVEVQLNWAYIDEGRAVLDYQTFLVEANGYRRPADPDTNFNARLIEQNGLLPDLAPNRFYGGSAPQPITMTFYLPPHVDLQTLPDTVDLRFEIVFEEQPRIQTALERLFSPGVSTGATTFGILPEATTESTPDITPTRSPLPNGFGPFVFDFTLPIRHAVSLQPMQTAISNGIAITLENVNVSPSKTDLRLCFFAPEGKFWWHGESDLFIGATSATPMGSESIVGDDGRTCISVYFELYAELPAMLTFTLGAIERQPATPDEFREAQRELTARGFPMNLEIHPDGTVSSWSWASGIEAFEPALVELGYRIEGPWIFTVDLPAY